MEKLQKPNNLEHVGYKAKVHTHSVQEETHKKEQKVQIPISKSCQG